MAVTTVCVAPSEAFSTVFSGGPLNDANRLMGELAERRIELDYLSQRPGKIFVDHFFDNPVTSSYIAFLAVHNAHLRTPVKLAELAILANLPGEGIARPDLLTDQALVRELYEIKPDSSSGLTKGVAKLARIDTFMARFALTYMKGSSYVPTPDILLASGTFPTLTGMVPFRMALMVRLSLPGLLQYKVCVTTDFAALGITALGVIAAILIALLLRGARLPGVPLPVPAFG